MTIKRYAGDKFTGLSSDTKPTAVPDGATFYETDTLKHYILASATWSEIVVSAGVNVAAQYTWTNTQTFSNTITFSSTINGTANNALYLGGVAAASYVNSSQLSTNLSNYALLSGATFTGNVTANNANTTYDLNVGRNLTVAGNTTITGNVTANYANTTLDMTVGRNLTVTGNLTIIGSSTVLQGNAVTFSDNMFYLNNGVLATITNISGNGTHVTFTADNNFQTGWDVFVFGVTPSSFNGSYADIYLANATHFVVANTNTDSYTSGGSARGKSDQNPDLGLAAGYNDGSYHHAGIFRDASDGYWKVFDNYQPEPDASIYIDTSNNTFHIADFWANTVRVGNTTVYSTINTTSFSGTANDALTANNSTYFNGYTWGSPAVLGGTVANGATFTSVNVGAVTGTGTWSTTGDFTVTGNIIFGSGTSADTRLFLNTYWTTDTTTTNFYVESRDNNTSLTALRNRYGIYSSLNNRNQNKSSDGLTTYNSNYRAVVGDVVSGSSSSGGNAFASELIGGNFRSYNYANGSGANGVNAALGTRNQVFSYGSGTITSAYGTQSQVYIGNSTVTGNITNGYGVYSEVISNTAATIATGYLFYGRHQGSTTTTKYGVYITGESNNYFSNSINVNGSAYVLGNTGLGVVPQTDTQLQSGITWTSDLSLWNQYNGTTDSNTAMTAARTKYGFQSSFSNRNQNKSSDGLTTYTATYRSIDGRLYNGSTTTGGDAYADEMQAGSFRAYNYANGVTSNTVGTMRGAYVEVGSYGSGVITNGYGSYNRIAIGNTTVTGNITTAYAVAARVESNTAATIGTGYLFHGRHDGSTTTTKYGIYMTSEANNYMSGNLVIGGTINAAAYTVGSTFIANTTQLTLSGVPLSVNGSVGTSGYVLTSNGSTGSPYWASAGAGSVDVNATYAWTNTHTFSNTVTFTGDVTIDGSPVVSLGALNMLRRGSFYF